MTFGTLISLKPSFTICKLELIISILLTLVLELKYLRPWAPMAGGWDSTPGQRTRAYMPQLKIPSASAKM